MAKKKAAKSKSVAVKEVELPAPSLPPNYVRWIISGGQTGVDRSALEIAIELNIPHGGWCPKGRLAEDGPIAEHFQLKETTSAQYWDRTEKNVLEAEGTLILYRGKLTRGSSLTRKYAQRHGKTFRCVQLKPGNERQLISMIRCWLARWKIKTLNIAGPRESTSPGIAEEAKTFLRQLLTRPKHEAIADESETWVSSRKSAPENVRLEATPRLVALIDSMQAGDELRRFETSPDTWQQRRGRSGYVLLRKGKIVARVVTVLN